MAVRIACTNADYAVFGANRTQECGSAGGSAAVMSNLENVTLQIRLFLHQLVFNCFAYISREKEAEATVLKHNNNGRVIGIRNTGGIQYGECDVFIRIYQTGIRLDCRQALLTNCGNEIFICRRVFVCVFGYPYLFNHVIVEHLGKTAAVVGIGVSVDHQLNIINALIL